MIRLQLNPLSDVTDAWSALQTAIDLEFATLPPYLYAMFSIPPGENVAAAQLIKSVAMQEMIHMCLGCNILNALGGTPALTPTAFPGPLPGDIGPVGGEALDIHLYPLSEPAMQQAMNIEQPETIPDLPIVTTRALLQEPAGSGTIGQFYARLDAFLATLPAGDWQPNRNQITDNQFFPGQLFAVNNYDDAHRAISQIVSEGEGAADDPLDFQEQPAHYYRFGEIFYNKVLTRNPAAPKGYQWGPDALGVDWTQVYPAICDPGTRDFSNDPPAAQAAQADCNAAFTAMVNALRSAVSGGDGQLGVAVRAMFELRLAAKVALHCPLADGAGVAGPAFIYLSSDPGAGA